MKVTNSPFTSLLIATATHNLFSFVVMVSFFGFLSFQTRCIFFRILRVVSIKRRFKRSSHLAGQSRAD
jgi:hypothetical protein